MNTLALALNAVLPHAAKPAENSAILENIKISPGKVIASDRYTLAESTWNTHEMPDFEPVLLHATHAKTVVGLKNILTVDINTEALTLTIQDGKKGTLTLPIQMAEQANFPNLERLWPDADKTPATLDYSQVSLLPRHLAKFDARHLGRNNSEKNTPLHIQMGDTRNTTLLLTFSDHFRALLMPYRVSR